MRHALTILMVILCLLWACNNARYTTVKHVKPVNYNRSYNKKKDKRKKRVKMVKKKILKRSKAVPPPRKKAPKTQKEKVEEVTAPEETQNEADSTGFLY